MCYPAAWVGQGIFITTGEIYVEHIDVTYPGFEYEIWTEHFVIPSGTYGPYDAWDLAMLGYGPGEWDPTSADPSGTISSNQVLTIRYLYTR
jgi:hypothetical protein